MVPLNPGNLDLKPEKGTEFEAGVDAGFLPDRVGGELTYFDKKTTDLLLQRPVRALLRLHPGGGLQPVREHRRGA